MLQEVIACADQREGDDYDEEQATKEQHGQLPSPIDFRFSDYSHRCFSYEKGKIVAIVETPIDHRVGRSAEYLVSYQVGHSNLTILNVLEEPEAKKDSEEDDEND